MILKLNQIVSLALVVSMIHLTSGCATSHVVLRPGLTYDNQLLVPKKNRTFVVETTDKKTPTRLKDVTVEKNILKGTPQYGKEAVSIPLESVHAVKVKDAKPGLTIAAIAGGVVVFLGILVGVALKSAIESLEED